MRSRILSVVFIFCLTAHICIAQASASKHDVAPLKVGEKFPVSVLKDIDNHPVDLNKLIAIQPAVIIFYRGGWCPYCNAHLAEVGSIEDQVLEMGYQVIAISPDAPENFQATIDKNEIRYTLLSDADGKLMTAIGIAYKAPAIKGNLLSKRSGGKNEGLLPVPSLFIVDTSGKILFEHIDPDYTTRISSRVLLTELKKLL